MKVFWSILAVLAIAATVLLAMPRKGGGGGSAPAPSARDASGGDPAPRTSKPSPGKPETGPGRKTEPDDEPETGTTPPSKTVEAAAVKPVEEIKPTPPPPPVAHAAVPATPAAAPAATSAPEVAKPAAAATPELPGKLNELVEAALGNGEAAVVPAAADAAKPAAGDKTPGSGAESKPALAAGATGAKIETKDDGTMIVDGRYPIKGKGTKAEPYEITWDYLISAEETYKPRLGQKELPARMNIVKGKWVKVTGYVAFPIMAQEADEMLAMLNQWDGCCIGVPPTPYDAIEVKLRDPAEKEDRFAVYGTVTGKLDIEPYLVKDWLIGLYTMSDAVLKAER